MIQSLFFISFLFLSIQSMAFTNANNLSAGGAGVAAVDPGVGVFMNPAILIHLQDHQFIFSTSQYETAVSISDSTSENLFPAAISYVKSQSKANIKNVSHETSVTLADRVGKNIAFGFSLKFNQTDYFSKSYKQVLGDVGLSYVKSENVGFGLVIKNAVANNADEQTPEDIRGQSQIIFGTNYIYQAMIRLRLDLESQAQYSMQKPILKTGFESILNPWIIARFGYFNDFKANSSGWTAGVAFNGPKFGLGYAYKFSNLSQESAQFVDFTVPF